ncbi:MAG TPA: hypothetical protein VHT91_50400 [Kofleriaceae bacterium]|nr:hypothetical protein [Kofleriaceae bacterium]
MSIRNHTNKTITMTNNEGNTIMNTPASVTVETIGIDPQTLALDQLETATGGFGWSSITHAVSSVGHAVAHGAGKVIKALDPHALEVGAISGGTAAATASETGPGALVAGAGGFLLGYGGALIADHGPQLPK